MNSAIWNGQKIVPFYHFRGFFLSAIVGGGHLQHKTCVPILHLLPSCKIATCCTNGMSGSPVREESDLKCITRFSTRCTTQLIIPEAIKHNRSSLFSILAHAVKWKMLLSPLVKGGMAPWPEVVGAGEAEWERWVPEEDHLLRGRG